MVAYGIKLSVEARFNGDVTLDAKTSEFARHYERELAKQDERVRYISFSRNFGKESGMYAGLENATGDYVVIMDADLQHPPAFLPKM